MDDFSFVNYFTTVWRTKTDDMKFGLTDFFNYFYDPTFKKGPLPLKMENRELRTNLLVMKKTFKGFQRKRRESTNRK